MQVLPPAQLFDRIHQRHGHYCPMSTLGGRMGFAARRRLGEVPLRAVYLLRTCAVDGIAVATGCSEADGSLHVRDEGRHALLVGHRGGVRGLEVVLRRATLDLAWEYRHLDEALERDRPTLDAAVLQRRHSAKALFLDQLLQRLRTLPEEDLLDVREAEADIAWSKETHA
ncbi:Formylmethanofuran dehydrogenase subunit E [Geoalkalibacter ferrihydriticus]|uniref:Formylmethanofuran dehydrogenase subunit E domain-containing protein n=2 Tax=Geoalkalibacter ferrihydriticus TaxID=392333 RepID=A0A0C2HKQ0_9BACT|nr:FmdE family protein [Geoalkalibacter ferrihydriticus]KIH75585.1 hypothetical protein GFER_15690 [Geoalkalibacter ferrihydriticus DSM 17813]SDL30730.1 Formylmethanofuran dehydrogenase subunit E [Geoalkalibacter ferrihydriticus]